MAENLDNPSFDFSIINTIETGAGNPELISGLLAPETASSSPEDIETLEEEKPVEKKTSVKAATKTAAKSEENEEEDDDDDKKKSKAGDVLKSFLEDSEEDDTQEDEDEQKDTTSKKVEKSKDDENEEEEGKETSQFTALSKDLFKLGVFSLGEDEEEPVISTPEEFLERFNEEKKKGAIEVVNSFIGQFGEDYQQAFEAIYVKGVDPKEYFSTYNNIVNFSELDLTKEENQEKVVRQALQDQGFDQEDIDTEIERVKNYGDLETVAQKHHKVLVKKEAVKLQELEKKAQLEQEQKKAIKQQYINNVSTVLQEKLKTKEFDGIPINPKLANEIQDFLLVDRYKTSSGETLTEFDKTILDLKRPENHAMKVKVALLLKILEKDPSLSTIQKTGISKKANSLFSEVARQADKSSVKSAKREEPKSWFS